MFNKNKNKNKKSTHKPNVSDTPKETEPLTPDMANNEVKEPSEIEVLHTECQRCVDTIIEQAKLLCTGKVRNVWELEKAARKLIESEDKIKNLQESNN